MKMFFILILSLLSTACNATDNGMKNGYKYENWGNNFISVTRDGETRQAIEGQVDRYLVNDSSLIATQKNLLDGRIAYWIIDMNTHVKVQYLDSHSFLNNAASLGFDESQIKIVIGS